MIDVTGSDDSDMRRIIQNMLECIVRLGMQNVCTLEEFKTLMVGAAQASRLSYSPAVDSDCRSKALPIEI